MVVHTVSFLSLRRLNRSAVDPDLVMLPGVQLPEGLELRFGQHQRGWELANQEREDVVKVVALEIVRRVHIGGVDSA
jgi:hypothetical protein